MTNPTDRRALKARNDELESSVTFWQAEALLNHFCAEHAKNTRQAGFYCTICAKPFVMSVPQGERPPKYKDLIAEAADLREQLAGYEQCVTCACGRPTWHRKEDNPL